MTLPSPGYQHELAKPDMAPTGDTVTKPSITAPVRPEPLALKKRIMLGVGLGGSLLMNACNQIITTGIADIQGGIGATADEGSWLLTIYLAASLAGVVISAPLIRTFGLKRCFTACSLVYLLSALTLMLNLHLGLQVSARLLQGLAAGFFGPMAFMCTFMVMGGPRLPFGLTLLGFILVIPATLGSAIGPHIVELGGWEGLYAFQAAIGFTLLLLALVFLQSQPIAWEGLATDWVAITLLSTAVGALTIMLSQGTRQFWFESPTIVLSLNIAIAAAAGFAISTAMSPRKLLIPGLFLRRGFSIPIILNLAFRASLVVSGYIVPQFLATVQGYRPMELSILFLWGFLAQLFSLPVVWKLLQWIDARYVMAFGLGFCGVAAIAASTSTGLTSANELHWIVVFFSIGQILFLAPDLMIGAMPLKLPELGTASLAFNLSTIGGTTLGTALISQFVTEREKFHSNILTEGLSLYNPLVADRLGALTSGLANQLGDDDAATARAIMTIGAAARKQAWILAYNDGFLIVGLAVILTIAGTLLLKQSRPHWAKQGKTS